MIGEIHVGTSKVIVKHKFRKRVIIELYKYIILRYVIIISDEVGIAIGIST